MTSNFLLGILSNVCGRYTISSPRKIVSEILGSDDDSAVEARYNVAPTQDAPVIVADTNGARLLTHMRWGLVPHWATNSDVGLAMINARAETAAYKPSFAESFRQRRCIVPADGFYEWQRKSGGRQPYLLRLQGGEPFTFAGLWDVWRGPNGTLLKTFTILTTTSNAVVEAIHGRMPVILGRQRRGEWLTTGSNVGTLTGLCAPYPAAAMETIPVSTYVNNVRHDSLECMQPVRLRTSSSLL